MKLSKICNQCGSHVTEKSRESFLDDLLVVTYSCGDTEFVQDLSKAYENQDITFADGTKPFKFQRENLQLILKSNFKAGIWDEMGLGKTISALLPFRFSDENPQSLNPKDLYPLAILVKAGLMHQWQSEVWKKLGKHSQLVRGKDEPLFEVFDVHIYSMDLLKNKSNLASLPYKSVIIDECQLIKNPESARAKSIVGFIKGNVDERGRQETIRVQSEGINLGVLPHEQGGRQDGQNDVSIDGYSRDINSTGNKNLICLSGTPIKNNAGEFFTVLNLLKPELFPSHDGFLRSHTQSYYNGPYRKTGGLRDPEGFKALTKDFTIRHTRKEVLPDLPAVIRDFQIRVLQEKAQESYLNTLEEYQRFYSSHQDWADSESRANILAYMNRLRHITGLSKTKDGIEFVIDFLNDCDRKLTVFHHHKDVGNILSNGLVTICKELGLEAPINISEEGLDDRERFRRVEQFVTNPRARILIASTLKSGEGLNLQVCSDCLVIERQWNSANEEQAEGRFTRIGSKADKVNAVYLIGAGTIDEMFTDIVERKRALVRDAMEGKQGSNFQEESVMRELSEVLFKSGMKKFSLKVPEKVTNA